MKLIFNTIFTIVFLVPTVASTQELPKKPVKVQGHTWLERQTQIKQDPLFELRHKMNLIEMDVSNRQSEVTTLQDMTEQLHLTSASSPEERKNYQNLKGQLDEAQARLAGAKSSLKDIREQYVALVFDRLNKARDSYDDALAKGESTQKLSVLQEKVTGLFSEIQRVKDAEHDPNAPLENKYFGEIRPGYKGGSQNLATHEGRSQ
jgi:chromosome segregation ATPase